MRSEHQGRPANVIQSAPQTSESINNKKSTDLLGNEIKTDVEGRYDLDQVKDRNVLEQFAMGLPVTTEQMIQMPKDTIEGVRSENQAMKESGLDLLLTPLIAPFAGQKELGITNKDWYWPEEINQAVGALPIQQESLPPFLRRGGGSTMGVLEGLSHNVSLFGEVAMHPATGAFRDEEFAKSGERFATAPAYYIGTAVGEIPYWFVGVGEAKLIASVGSKAAAIAVTSAAKTGNIPKITKIAQMIKAERTHFALEKALVKERKIAGGLLQTAYADGQGAKSSIRTLATISPKVKNAINILKKDDANMVKIQIDEQVSHIKSLEKKQNEMNNKISTETDGAAKKILRAERDKLTDEIKSANDRISDIRSSAKTSKTASLERQLDELLKSATDSPTAENRLRYLKLVEDEVSPLMKKKYDDVKLTSDNIMRMRREALITKKFKLNQKIKEAEKSIDPKTQKKITSYQEELKDIQYKLDFHENIRIDELIKSIRAAPETIPRRITKRFEKRATTPGTNDVENFFKRTMESKAAEGQYDGVTGSLRFVKDWYEGGINKVKNREVQFWTDKISGQIPELNLITEKQMKGIMLKLSQEKKTLIESLDAEISAHNLNYISTVDIRSKKRGTIKTENVPTVIKRLNPDIDKDVLSRITSIWDDIEIIDNALYNESRYSFKVPGSDNAYLEYDVIRQLSPEVYAKVKPKEVIFTTRPTVTAVKSKGVITVTIGNTGWEGMIYPKRQPPQSKLRRRLKPAIPNPLKQLTDENSEMIFYSAREMGGPFDPDPKWGSKSKFSYVVRVPKRLSDEAKGVLRRQGYMRPLKKENSPLPMEGLPGDMELWEMIPITERQRTGGDIFTGNPRSISTKESESYFTADYIESFRDMLRNTQDEGWFTKKDVEIGNEIESINEKLRKGSKGEIVLSQSDVDALMILKKDAEQRRVANTVDAQKIEPMRKIMAALNISPYGIPRGSIIHFKDPKVITNRSPILQSNVIIDKITNKKYVMIGGTKNKTGMFEVLDDRFFDLYREPGADVASRYVEVVPDPKSEKGFNLKTTKLTGDEESAYSTSASRDAYYKDKATVINETTLDINQVASSPNTKWKNIVRAVSPEELDEMNSMTNLGNIQSKIQKRLDSIDQTETIVKEGEGATDISSKSKKKTISDFAKITLYARGKKSIRNIRRLIEDDRFEIVDDINFRPHSSFTDRALNENVIISLPENNPIAQIFATSTDALRVGDDVGSTPMTVQPSMQELGEIRGVSVYGIYDTQIVSGVVPDDFLTRSLANVIDDHDKFNKFKTSKGNTDIETLKNIINNDDISIGQRNAIKKQIIRSYLENVEKMKPDADNFDKAVKKRMDTNKFNEILIDLETKDMFRAPTKKERIEYWKKKKSFSGKKTLDNYAGVVNPNRTLSELSFMFSSGDIRQTPSKIRSYLLGKLVTNDLMFTSPESSTLLTSGLSKMVYGINKKRMIGIMQNPGVRKGYIDAIEFKRDHGVKLSRGEARIYNMFKGQNLTDMQGALVRQGVNPSGIRNEFDVGFPRIQGKDINTVLRDEINKKIQEIETRNDISKKYSNIPLSKKKIKKDMNDLADLYIQKTKVEKVYKTPEETYFVKTRLSEMEERLQHIIEDDGFDSSAADQMRNTINSFRTKHDLPNFPFRAKNDVRRKVKAITKQVMKMQGLKKAKGELKVTPTDESFLVDDIGSLLRTTEGMPKNPRTAKQLIDAVRESQNRYISQNMNKMNLPNNAVPDEVGYIQMNQSEASQMNWLRLTAKQKKEKTPKQIEYDEWMRFDPFEGSIETMDYDLAAIITKRTLLDEWGVSEDAYKTTSELLREIEIRKYIGTQMNDAQKILSDQKSTPAQVTKAQAQLVSASRSMERSQERVSAISQAMASTKTSTLQKQVTPGKPANPASLPERIISFGIGDFVPQQIDSGWNAGQFTPFIGSPQYAFAETQLTTTPPAEEPTLRTSQEPVSISKTLSSQEQQVKDNQIESYKITPFEGLKDIQNIGERAASITGLASLSAVGMTSAMGEKAVSVVGERLPLIEDTILKTTQIQDQFIRQRIADAPNYIPVNDQRIFPAERPYPYSIGMPRRIFPPIIGFPPIGYERAQERRRQRRGKSRKKKQWWQTPEWWYQPYYWGGKDQMGAGYTTFTGREPSKVKRYEKQFFGGF